MMESHDSATDVFQPHPLVEPRPYENEQDDDSSDEYKDHTTDESDNESDFFADSESVPDDAYTTNYGGSGNMMIMDLSNVCPVGGLRRVSSCYFSICSNISSEENHPNSFASTSGNDSRVNSPTCEMAIAANMESLDDTANCIPTAAAAAADFLYHDILMSVFSYLDASSLAAFSETAKRPNFECFYFLELQLQRALLRGTTSRSGADAVGDEDGLCFIAGTGVISRVGLKSYSASDVALCAFAQLLCHVSLFLFDSSLPWMNPRRGKLFKLIWIPIPPFMPCHCRTGEHLLSLLIHTSRI